MFKFVRAVRCTPVLPCRVNGVRSQHHTVVQNSGEGFQEIRIPVPWGHIAGKWWGQTNIKPLLGLHGWQDNAGTWDRLALLLPDHISLLAIDFPGHGFSSRLPRGLPYRLTDQLYVMKYILRHFGWDKVSVLAHSMGAVQTFVYASLYSAEIENLICVDAFKPLSVNADVEIDRLAQDIDIFLETDSRDESARPLYTYEEIVKKLHGGMVQFPLSEESCKVLLKRGMVKSGDKFYFATDPRMKITRLSGWLHETILEMAANITCNVLFIKANPGFIFEKPEITQETLDLIKKSAKRFEYHIVDGYHHVHLDHPERVAPIIINFLNSEK